MKKHQLKYVQMREIIKKGFFFYVSCIACLNKSFVNVNLWLIDDDEVVIVNWLLLVIFFSLNLVKKIFFVQLNVVSAENGIDVKILLKFRNSIYNFMFPTDWIPICDIRPPAVCKRYYKSRLLWFVIFNNAQQNYMLHWLYLSGSMQIHMHRNVHTINWNKKKR